MRDQVHKPEFWNISPEESICFRFVNHENQMGRHVNALQYLKDLETSDFTNKPWWNYLFVRQALLVLARIKLNPVKRPEWMSSSALAQKMKFLIAKNAQSARDEKNRIYKALQELAKMSENLPVELFPFGRAVQSREEATEIDTVVGKSLSQIDESVLVKCLTDEESIQIEVREISSRSVLSQLVNLTWTKYDKNDFGLRDNRGNRWSLQDIRSYYGDNCIVVSDGSTK